MIPSPISSHSLPRVDALGKVTGQACYPGDITPGNLLHGDFGRSYTLNRPVIDEVLELADKARERKLAPADMQGGCFTISSLGNIGGNGFTPIVNAPEVGILGVSRAAIKPVWDGQGFAPRTLLPLALSYDHRVINGGDGGRFLSRLVALLGDIRQLLM